MTHWILVMNPFAAALAKPLPQPMTPADFDLKVCVLSESRAVAITRAVHRGQLDGYICEGELWVRRADLHDLLPPGHCTFDELDACCFIAPDLDLAESDDPALIFSIT
jgi:hypothetical protein